MGRLHKKQTFLKHGDQLPYPFHVGLMLTRGNLPCSTIKQGKGTGKSKGKVHSKNGLLPLNLPSHACIQVYSCHFHQN